MIGKRQFIVPLLIVYLSLLIKNKKKNLRAALLLIEDGLRLGEQFLFAFIGWLGMKETNRRFVDSEEVCDQRLKN